MYINNNLCHATKRQMGFLSLRNELDRDQFVLGNCNELDDIPRKRWELTLNTSI